jgi:hypothetical protein
MTLVRYAAYTIVGLILFVLLIYLGLWMRYWEIQFVNYLFGRV